MRFGTWQMRLAGVTACRLTSAVIRPEGAPMRVSSMQCIPGECDGCGVQAPGPDPAGWFDRELDPPYYPGPRRLLFCPRCFAALAAGQRPRWRCLGKARPPLERTAMLRRRVPLQTLLPSAGRAAGDPASAHRYGENDDRPGG